MRFYLTGLPGSGKTTLGRKLAKHIGYAFIDTDKEICKLTGATVEEIFAEKGEAFFRSLEREILLKVSDITDAVISTGGGTPCFHDNMKFINEKGISFFLNPPMETIAERLSASHKKEKRPLLKGKNAREVGEFLEQKMQERFPYYRQAHIEVKEEKISPKKLLKKLKAAGYKLPF